MGSLLEKFMELEKSEKKEISPGEKKIAPEPEKNIDSLIEPQIQPKKLKIGSADLDILSKSLELIPSKLEKIRFTLDTLKISQSDLWHMVDYFCKNLLSGVRVSKTDLTPIFLDFINKKLKSN